MTLPLLLLAIGSIAAGFIFKDIFIGQQSSEFWGNSIFFIEKIELENIPLWLVLLTPIIVLFAIPISYYLYQKNTKVLEDFKKTNSPLYNFLLNKWYVDELYDFLFVNPIKRLGLIFWKKGDQNTIDKFGPDGVSRLVKYISNKASQFQTGYIYDYAFVMLIGLTILITYLILK